MQQNINYGSFVDMEYNNNRREKIKSKLIEIEKITDIKSIGLEFKETEMEINEIVLSDAEERLNIYENISMLGIYVICNYCFFSKLIVQSAFKCSLYKEAMQKLGYCAEGDLWFLKSKPDEDAVIDFIFQFLFYSYVVQSKTVNKVKHNEKNGGKEKNTPFSSFIGSGALCIYCDSELSDEGICNVCGNDYGKMGTSREKYENENFYNNKISSSIDHSPNKGKQVDFYVESNKGFGDSGNIYLEGSEKNPNLLISTDDIGEKDTHQSARQTENNGNCKQISKALTTNPISNELEVNVLDIDKENSYENAFDEEADVQDNEMVFDHWYSINESSDIDYNADCGIGSQSDLIDRKEENIPVDIINEQNPSGSNSSNNELTTIPPSLILENNFLIGDSNTNCMSNSMLEDEKLENRNEDCMRSEIKQDLLPHSNEMKELFDSATMEAGKTTNALRNSSLSWECSICTYHNNRDTENCIICRNIRNIPTQNVDNEVINEIKDLGKEDLPYIKIEEKERNDVDDEVIHETFENESKDPKEEDLYNIKNEGRKRNLDSLENMEKNTWECKICKFSNKESTTKCETCLMMRDGYSVIQKEKPLQIQFGDPDESWLCNSCNTHNNVDVVKCSHCSSLAEFVNNWKCEICTFYNDILANVCKACGYENSHLTTEEIFCTDTDGSNYLSDAKKHSDLLQLSDAIGKRKRRGKNQKEPKSLTTKRDNFEESEKSSNKKEMCEIANIDLFDYEQCEKINTLELKDDAEADAEGKEMKLKNDNIDYPMVNEPILNYDSVNEEDVNVPVEETVKVNLIESKCVLSGSSKNKSSSVFVAESAVAEGNFNCMSADSDSMLKDRELKMGDVRHRKRSETSPELSTHSNDKGESFGNANLESDKTSSLGSWLCSYCTYCNDEKAANCAICMKLRNTQKINVNDVVINDDLEDEKGELLEDVFYENDIKIEERERSLELLDNNTKNTWECKICTCVNDESVNHCEACFMMRDEVVLAEKRDFIDIDIGEPDERWFCKKCNTRNEVDVVKCAHCSSLADFVNKWKCEKCTFYNYALVTFCRACGYKNLHLAKCAQCRYGAINIQLGGRICMLCDNRNKKEEKVRKSLFERKPKEKETIEKLISSIYRDYVAMDNEVNNQYNGTLQRRLLDDSGLFDQKRHREYEMNARQFNSKRNETLGQNKIDENKAECPICKKCFNKRESRWCQTCEQNRWRCPDKDCRRINFGFRKYCIKCGTKKGSDLSNGHSFYKLVNNKKIGLYKCEHCHRCNNWKRDKCVYCKTPRQINTQCGKCSEVHDPQESCARENMIDTLDQ